MACTTVMSQDSAVEKKKAENEEEQIKRIGTRLDRFAEGILGQISFTMAHAGGLDNVNLFMKTIGAKEEHGKGFSFKAAVSEAGGLTKYRRRVAELLANENVLVRGYGAQWLGIVGDDSCKDDLARLLKSKNLLVNYEKMSKDDLVRLLKEKKVNVIPDEMSKDEIDKISKEEIIEILKSSERDLLTGFDREQAAVALGMLRASEYAKDLVALLQDSNGRVRAGAVTALGVMEAKQHADDIAKVLDFKSEMDPYAETARASAIIAIAKLDAKQQTPAIAKCLAEHNSAGSCAIYALVALNAKEQTKQIGALLKDDFKAGEAALALALLGATEYTDSINELLKHKNDFGFIHCKAAFALGILRAKGHIPDIVEFMKSSKDYEQDAAAWAIVMMESKQHAADAVEIIKKHKKEDCLYLWPPEEGEFLAADQFFKVEQSAVKLFTKLQKEIDDKKSVEKK